MNHDSYSDDHIREIMNSVKTIAMVGASPQNVRPSYFVFKYLAERGYDMIPINPGQVGKNLIGKPFIGALREIGRPVDMVDIFRSADHIMPVLDEILALPTLPKVMWLQLGVRHDEAAAKAEAAGITVIMNRCPEDRIWPAVVGDRLDGRQFAHPELEARPGADHGNAIVAEPRQHRRRRHGGRRPRCKRQERRRLSARSDRFVSRP